MAALKGTSLGRAYMKHLQTVNSIDAARELLSSCDIQLKGPSSGSEFRLVVEYLKPGRPHAYRGDIASVSRNPGGWELLITTPAYFYGDGYGDYGITCQTYADWLDYIIMNLATHQRGDGVVLVSRG